LTGATIVFDLDGTLVDTAPDLVRATNVVMDAAGLPRVPLHEVRNMTGQGARALIVKAAARAGVTFDDEDLKARITLFLDAYRMGLVEMSRPFDGVTDALDALTAAGAVLAVCTNKPPTLARPVLDAFDLSRRFVAIVAGGEAAADKPSADHILHTLALAGGSSARALMVGDSITDLQAARNAGIPVILATFGYTNEKASALGADAVFDHYGEVPGLAMHHLA
jgi:phosphoglycolate phosphatase